MDRLSKWVNNFVNKWKKNIAANQEYALLYNQLDKHFYRTSVQESPFSTQSGINITKCDSRFPKKDTNLTQVEFFQKLESEALTKG